MPANRGRRVAHRAAVTHELERAANLGGSIRLDLDAARSGPPVAVRQAAALRAGPRLALGLRAPARRHPGDDHAPVISRDAVADRVEQQRRGVARPVRAIGVEDLHAGGGERPERVVRRVLVARQPRPLLHEQDPGAVLEAVGERGGQLGAFGHRQRAAAVLEPVGHDLERVELRERLAGSTLALGAGCSLLLGAGHAPVDHASLRTEVPVVDSWYFAPSVVLTGHPWTYRTPHVSVRCTKGVVVVSIESGHLSAFLWAPPYGAEARLGFAVDDASVDPGQRGASVSLQATPYGQVGAASLTEPLTELGPRLTRTHTPSRPGRVPVAARPSATAPRLGHARRPQPRAGGAQLRDRARVTPTPVPLSDFGGTRGG